MKTMEIARALAAAYSAADAGPESDASDLDALTRLPGLGRRRARQLHDELGIRSLEELAAALLDGRVGRLKGFGGDACERLRLELQTHFAGARRFALADAERHAAPVVDYMRSASDVERVEIVGSVRRRCATVGDVDILVVSGRPALAMRRFTAYPAAVRSEATDASRGWLVLHCGLRIDVRVVPRRCFGATLHSLTGSAAHNAAVRQLGLQRGFRISEYGTFSVDHRRAGARRTGGQHEEDVFTALGIDWIPPELREDRGELELAAHGELPRLVSLQHIRGDLGLRAERTGPALAALAQACSTQGYEYCGTLADGTADGGGAGGARTAGPVDGWPPGCRVLRGITVAIGPDGRPDASEARLEQADIVVLEPRTHARLSPGRMTDGLLRALEHPAIDVLAWPARLSARDLDCDTVFAAAAASGVALELTAADAPADELLHRARELGVRVAVSAGAQAAEPMAMAYAVDRARRGWFEPDHVVNTCMDAALAAWLRRRMPHRGAVAAGIG